MNNTFSKLPEQIQLLLRKTAKMLLSSSLKKLPKMNAGSFPKLILCRCIEFQLSSVSSTLFSQKAKDSLLNFFLSLNNWAKNQHSISSANPNGRFRHSCMFIKKWGILKGAWFHTNISSWISLENASLISN